MTLEEVTKEALDEKLHKMLTASLHRLGSAAKSLADSTRHVSYDLSSLDAAQKIIELQHGLTEVRTIMNWANQTSEADDEIEDIAERI